MFCDLFLIVHALELAREVDKAVKRLDLGSLSILSGLSIFVYLPDRHQLPQAIRLHLLHPMPASTRLHHLFCHAARTEGPLAVGTEVR